MLASRGADVLSTYKACGEHISKPWMHEENWIHFFGSGTLFIPMKVDQAQEFLKTL